MEFPAERAEFGHESFFNKVMHVFGVGAERIHPPRIRLRARDDLIQGPESLLHFRRAENGDGLQSLGPSAVHSDLVGQKTLVECEGALERVEALVGREVEAAAPEFGVFAIGHGANTVDIEERSFATLRMTNLGITAGFGFGLGADSDGKREEIDEAFGILWVVFAHGETGQVGAIEREGRLAAGDVEGALPKFQADGTGDALLRHVEEAVERFALRREPCAVVDKFGVAQGKRLRDVGGLAVDGEALEFAMRRYKKGSAGRFVRAAGLHAHKAILDKIGAAHTVSRRDFIEQVQQIDGAQLRSVHGCGVSGLETYLDFLGLVGSLFRRNSPLPHGFVWRIGRVFEFATFVAQVPDVTVTAVNVLLGLLNGNLVLFGVRDGILAGVNVPFTPWRDNLQIGRDGLVSQFKANLVVAFSGAAVGKAIRTELQCEFRLALGEHGSRHRCAQQ